jgi:uncharacterized membrane protein SpoIIM required for sporulation
MNFGIAFLSIGYNLVAFSPQEFVQLPEAKEYESKVAEISAMDKWSRTQLYWSHNLGTAGSYVTLFPAYLSLVSNVATGYAMGIAIAYYNAEGDWRYALTFSAQLFIHGILELTGIFIIGAACFRLAWKFWAGIGHLTPLSLKKSARKEIWKEISRQKGKVKLEIFDFLVLFTIGIIAIFFAGPIESYVSPVMARIFLVKPWLAGLFLVAVGAFYLSLARFGFRQMLRNLREVWKDIKLGLGGKFRASQAPVLMLVVLLWVLLFHFILL